MSTSPLPASATSQITIDETRQLVNEYLSGYFADKITKATKVHPSYAKLWEAIDSLFNSGGKRFRPYMMLLAYQAAGGARPIQDILPAASAQEIVHFAMLVHDDIIDRDTVRWGAPNIAGQYRQAYASKLSPEEAEHYANAAALLAGDLLLSGAYELTNRLPLAAKAISEASQTLSDAIFAVSGGELIDTESAFIDSPATAEIIATHKTASYSFIGPFVMGAQLAEASDMFISAISAFGLHLGIAFQLQDDLLSVFGDSSVTGKTTIGDIREGKRTYLIEQFYQLATAEQIQQFELLYGKADITDEDADIVRVLLKESGAEQATRARIEHFSVQAETALQQLQLQEQYHDAFERLIALCTKRVK